MKCYVFEQSTYWFFNLLVQCHRSVLASYLLKALITVTYLAIFLNILIKHLGAHELRHEGFIALVSVIDHDWSQLFDLPEIDWRSLFGSLGYFWETTLHDILVNLLFYFAANLDGLSPDLIRWQVNPILIGDTSTCHTKLLACHSTHLLHSWENAKVSALVCPTIAASTLHSCQLIVEIALGSLEACWSITASCIWHTVVD